VVLLLLFRQVLRGCGVVTLYSGRVSLARRRIGRVVLFVATGHNLRRPLIRIRQVLPVVLLRLLLLALFSYGSCGFVIVLRIEPVLVGTTFLH